MSRERSWAVQVYMVGVLGVLGVLGVPACSQRGGAAVAGDAGRVDASRSDVAVAPPDSHSPVDSRVPDTGPPLSDVLIYAHSRDTLYTFSPFSLEVELVGVFTLADGSAAPYMLDLAVSASGEVYTVSGDALFRVDGSSGRVTEIGEMGLGAAQLYALSFLVAGEYDPDSETLVGATNDGAYYAVDTSNARTSLLGRYPDGWLSSGDIVSIEGLGTFATVRRADFPSDVLVQVLFAADGSSVAVVRGPIRSADRDFTQIFGLGYWGRALYGFTNAGELLEINRDTGAGALVTGDTGTSQFWGAGVTTRVPVLF